MKETEGPVKEGPVGGRREYGNAVEKKAGGLKQAGLFRLSNGHWTQLT